jgi:thiosulfate/3-mercaptopyruvate sulfurtransferase
VDGGGVEPLVSVDWLNEHVGEPDVRVFDVTVQVSRGWMMPRIRAGSREYRAGHIPGSAFIDLLGLHDPARPKHTMTAPTPEHFAAAVGADGLGSEHRVVLYDRRQNMWAARMWWLLRVFGHDQAAILDGGWGAWQAAGYPICTRRCAYPPATFRPHPRAELMVGKEEVQAAIDDPQVVLVNALGRQQHRGEVKEYLRRGHIPGSLNVTAWEILDRDTGCYRPAPQLRQKSAQLLAADRVITYCGSGAAAASLAHVLVRLGHPNVAIYDGGLVEWCADRSLPLQTGPLT